MKELFILAELQEKTKEDDGLGGWIEDWGKVRDIHGVLDMLNHDVRNAGKELYDSTHVFLCDVQDVSEKQRIIYGGKVYQIKHVDKPVTVDSHLEIYLKFEGDLDEA